MNLLLNDIGQLHVRSTCLLYMFVLRRTTDVALVACQKIRKDWMKSLGERRQKAQRYKQA